MAESRVWAAALGTPLDGPGWTEIGTLANDGLVLKQVSVLDCSLPAGPVTLTITTRFSLTWYAYRWVFDHTSPRASRVKREYHRRRR